ncbi:MAG: stage III sporulation protein AB [Oscillospiraceae bacterium]
MVVRLLLCGVIVASTTLVSRTYSGRLTGRIDQLKLIERMLAEVQIYLDFSAYTVTEILDRLRANPALSALSFLECSPSPYTAREDIDRAVRGWESLLSEEETEHLRGFFRELGTSGVDGQMELVRLYREQFSAARERLVLASAPKLRLYNALGVLSGVFISVMII